ncbi:MAG: hypothetical protein HY874_10280 [Chloroflexi bacterium]|nr:hypothetical protein [Chloroflexota bacterium]
MKQLSLPLVHEPALIAAGALNALVFGILTWRLDGPVVALAGAAGGAFPWACIAMLQRMRRGGSWISSLLLILAMVLTGAALVTFAGAATWAGTCWDCAASRYTHDPPTRGFMFFVWTWLVWLTLNAALVVLTLLALGRRLFARPGC